MRTSSRISLAARLRLGIGAIILAFTISGAVSVIGIVSSARDVTKIIDKTGPTFSALDTMESTILREGLFTLAYQSDPSEIPAILAERRAFERQKNELARILPEAAAAINGKILADYADYVALQDSIIEVSSKRIRLMDEGASGKLISEANKEVWALKDALIAAQSSFSVEFQGKVRGPIMMDLQTARDYASATAWRSLVLLGILTLAAIAIGGLVGTMLLRSIRVPIAGLVDGMDRIASGDREARLEDVGVAEFEELQSGFNDMAERLDEAEQGLKRSYEGQRKLLDALPVGFLTMGRDFRVEPEYSLATERLIRRSDIAGTAFPELLFPSGEDGRKAELGRYIKQLFENRTADDDFLAEMNPVRELRFGGDEGERFLAVSFDRLCDDSRVESVLATIEDRTEVLAAETALEAERRSHKRDSDSIQAILSIGPGPLKDFFTETREMIGRIREGLGRLDDAAEINSCFRLLHSIKGAAGSFGIEAIVMTAHEAEDIFAELRETEQAPSTQELVRINLLLGSIGEALDGFEDLVQRLKSTLSALEESDARGEERNELDEFLKSLPTMVDQLQRSLAKPMRLETKVEIGEIPRLKEMRQVIIHLIRNAADHGLEDEYERLFQGKAKDGRIWLRIRPKDEKRSAYLIEVEDDGQGINFDRIAEKALEKGLLAKEEPAADKSRLLSMLFRPGFSTKEKADEISGRGVGLDLVRDIVKSLGGNISVSSSRGRGTKFTITVPY
jgi:signal transduction histidine kinase